LIETIRASAGLPMGNSAKQICAGAAELM
jgi:hypothetical protein